jgi:carboxylesterase type B
MLGFGPLQRLLLITLLYRLSTLGFLAIPGTDIKGNYGIADQITALEVISFLPKY